MRPLVLCCLVTTALSAAEEATTMRTSLAEVGVYDHRHVVDPGWSDDQLAAARALGVALGHAPRDDRLVTVLRELGVADDRFALRSDSAPGKRWFRDGGLGTYQVGASIRPETRIEGWAKRVARRDLAAEIDLGVLTFAVDDISDGREVEIAHEVYRARIDIRHYSVSLADVTTENITAQRQAGRGSGGGAVFTQDYPIELPTLSVDGVNTSVVAPAGTSSGTISELRTRPRLHPRDARVAIRFYRELMGSLQAAYPDTVWVWTTVPLAPRGNFQRNSFNHYVRAQVAAIPSELRHRMPLYDLAAIVSHDPEGVLQMDRQGPVVAPVYLDPDGALTAEARQRLAVAWWALLVDVAGRG